MNIVLPQHKLHAYGVARELYDCVCSARIRGAHLRDQAERAAESCVLNVAEGAGRVTRADKARVFAIARAECVEALAAIEIAAARGLANAEAFERAAVVGNRLYAMLTRLIR